MIFRRFQALPVVNPYARWIRLSVEVVIVLFAVFWLNRVTARRLAADYFQFWTVGAAVRNLELGSVYHQRDANLALSKMTSRPDASRRMRNAAKWWPAAQLTATPLFYAVIASLSVDSYERDYRVFRQLSFSAYIIGVLLVARGLRLTIPELVVMSAALLAVNYPLRRDASWGNAAQLQYFMVGLTVWLASSPTRLRTGLCGAVVAFAALFKPTLLLAGIFLSAAVMMSGWSRARAYLLGVAAACAVGVLWPMAVLGNECTWTDWFGKYSHFVFRTVISFNITFKLFGVPLTRFLAEAVAVVAILTLAVISIGRFRGDQSNHPPARRFIAAYLAGVAGMFLTTPVVHDHYFLLLSAAGAYYIGRPTVWRSPVQVLIKLVGLAAFFATLWPTSKHLPYLRMGYVVAVLLYLMLNWELYSPSTLSRYRRDEAETA